jgi:RNA methyltransferase, TrmH family
MITSADNDKLKTIRKLQQKRWRTKLGLFSAEGEDLIRPGAEFVLRSGEDVEPELLDAVSTLGSGTRVIGVYKQHWGEPTGDLLVYLHGVEDPGNVGTIIRSAHAFADGPVILGPGCADPYSPKAVRASMGSIFARPPAKARFEELTGTRIAYVMGGPDPVPVDGPVVVCIGGERYGLDEVADRAEVQAGIPMQDGAPNSLNAAMAATVALYDRFRMARHG